MPYLNESYFTGAIYLPFKNPEFLEFFRNSLKDLEKNLLIDIFGYDFYKQFTDGIAQASPDQKWIDIRDGQVYTDKSDVYQEYKGIVNVFKYFVYCKIINIQSTQTSVLGEVTGTIDNSNDAYFQQEKVRQAFNNGIDNVNSLVLFVNNQNDTVENTYVNFVLGKNYEKKINMLWI